MGTFLILPSPFRQIIIHFMGCFEIYDNLAAILESEYFSFTQKNHLNYPPPWFTIWINIIKQIGHCEVTKIEGSNYLSVIVKTIPFCTIITDIKNPFGSSSGSSPPGTRVLDHRIKSFCTSEIWSDKYIYMNEDNDKCPTETISEVLHFLSDSDHPQVSWQNLMLLVQQEQLLKEYHVTETPFEDTVHYYYNVSGDVSIHQTITKPNCSLHLHAIKFFSKINVTFMAQNWTVLA